MCFELIARPFALHGCRTMTRMSLLIKALLKFYASQSHFITTHRFAKIVCFPFNIYIFFWSYKRYNLYVYHETQTLS